MGNIKKTIRKVAGFIIAVGAVGGLILLGWGFGDIGGFFAHPARVIVPVSMVIMFFLFTFLAEKLGVSFTRKGKKEKRKELVTGVALPTLITILLLIVAPYSDSHNFLVLGSDVLRYLGVVIYISGCVFSCWGPAHLGRQFSGRVTIQKEHKLITDGPFRYMRHPRYSGILQWVFGIALIFGSVLGLVGALLMTILFVRRIKYEEEMLHREFGKEWEEYRQRTTKKVIPLVY